MSEYIYATDGHEGHWLTGEEIVRCRDCEKYGLGRRCGWSKRFVTPDGFCAWGERRTNE